MMKMQIPEWLKITFKLSHWSIAIVLLCVCILFAYEKNVTTFSDSIDVFSVVATKAEFEGDEPISFFVLAAGEESKEVSLYQTLLCDYGDGNGYGHVSSVSSMITAGKHDNDDITYAKALIEVGEETFTVTQSVNRLRRLIQASDVSDYIVFSGALPRETAQCLFKFTFSRYTDNFNLLKEYEISSYPFEYIWYFDGGDSID